jgi:hypothetical protein
VGWETDYAVLFNFNEPRGGGLRPAQFSVRAATKKPRPRPGLCVLALSKLNLR